MKLRPHLPRAQLHADLQRVEQLGDVVVGDRHPLRHTGGARGVDQVGEVIGGRRRQRGAGLGANTGILDIDHGQGAPVEPVGQRGGGDRGDRGRVGQHELQPRIGDRRVDRQVSRPGLEHRQHRHDRLSAARRQQRHTTPRARAMAGQQMRQPVSGSLQLAIGHRAALKAHRHRLGGARHLRGPHQRNRHRRGCGPGQHRPVTDLIEAGVLTGIEHIDRREPPGGIGGHRRQHLLQPLDQRLDAGRIKHLGVVFDTKTQLSPRPGDHRQRIVGGIAAGDIGDGQPVGARQRGGVDRIVLIHAKGVEQLFVTGDAVDLGKRQVLVLEGVVVGALQLAQQLGGGGCRRDGCPYRHRVNEQAHHRFRAGHLVWPTRDHRAEDDIVLAGQTAQQPREGAVQHDADRGVTRAGQLAYGLGELFGQPTRDHALPPCPQRAQRGHQGRGVKTGEQLPPGHVGGLQIPVSQPGNKPAMRDRRCQPLVVIAGKHLPQQDRE
ncbi:hypothetical protein LAUMK13_03011 [Mycobacterium innocens]|uniref:Uncharacterized protein n=1 Tax=Mycobacterium innocens TaxID=2341083 RepID=A0A498Q5W6_9MYCO|nr:hypothetical protein LAUMK13_03011 [Mycobacterium innocens]